MFPYKIIALFIVIAVGGLSLASFDNNHVGENSGERLFYQSLHFEEAAQRHYAQQQVSAGYPANEGMISHGPVIDALLAAGPS